MLPTKQTYRDHTVHCASERSWENQKNGLSCPDFRLTKSGWSDLLDTMFVSAKKNTKIGSIPRTPTNGFQWGRLNLYFATATEKRVAPAPSDFSVKQKIDSDLNRLDTDLWMSESQHDKSGCTPIWLVLDKWRRLGFEMAGPAFLRQNRFRSSSHRIPGKSLEVAGLSLLQIMSRLG